MNSIDLFCGCGGFSKGMEKAGINVEYGFDIFDEALKSFEENHFNSTSVKMDLSSEIPKKWKNKEFDIVFGSPPCQGFSHAKGERSKADKRNNLVFDFIKWVSTIQPRFVVMENVSGITNISDDFINKVKKEYRDAGYKVKDKVLNSASYGVPQKRKRYILIGVHNTEDKLPSFPPVTHHISSKETQKDLKKFSKTLKKPVSIGEAISDLPTETKDEEDIILNESPKNRFQKWVRDGNKTSQHIAKDPNEKDMGLIKRIPEGKMYRSSRFGNKYIGVWDLYEDKFDEEEKHILWFISKHRNRKDYKSKDKSGPDYIPIEKIEGKNDKIRKLYEKGWLRRKENYNDYSEAYDINTKSGVRPKYMRLSRKQVSNTIDTHSFNPREKLHPTENRGLSLREGARIQSFPDEFKFYGNFKNKAKQIGNAVPPKLSYHIGKHLKKIAKK